MDKSKALKISLSLGLIFIGVKMESKEFKQYGLIAGEPQIQASILMACNVISPGTADKAKFLLAETIAVESLNGTATDHSTAYGEGLTQFDKPTFEDVKQHFLQPRFKDLKEKINTLLNVDIAKIQYSDLRRSPMASIVFARLLYFRVPYPIPDTLLGRWQYYKKWFNSSLGATTESKYMRAQQYAVFQDKSFNKVA